MRGPSFTAADLQPLRRAGVIAELVRPSLAAPPGELRQSEGRSHRRRAV
jgi:hypothetical protein